MISLWLCSLIALSQEPDASDPKPESPAVIEVVVFGELLVEQARQQLEQDLELVPTSASTHFHHSEAYARVQEIKQMGGPKQMKTFCSPRVQNMLLGADDRFLLTHHQLMPLMCRLFLFALKQKNCRCGFLSATSR